MDSRSIISAILASLAIAAGAPVGAQTMGPPCGSLSNSFGPFDYRTASHADKELVESYHYGPQVDALIRGMTGELGADISYTLVVFPNHHRALLAMSRLGDRLKRPQAPGAKYTVECYFERALRFRNDDTVARMLYANWLINNNREADARKQLEETKLLGVDNPFTQYNVGLIYFDLKDYDKALVQAHTAMAMGFAPPALEAKLKAIGKWKDPVPAAPSDAASGSGSSTGAAPAAMSSASAAN